MPKKRPSLNKKQSLIVCGVGLAVLAPIIAIGAMTERHDAAAPLAQPTLAAEQTAKDETVSSTQPQPATQKADTVITAHSSKSFAKVLKADDEMDLFAQFASRHHGETVKFNGVIANVQNHGSYKTRFDVLVLAGNRYKATVRGPNFRFTDVNLVSDLKLKGDDVPDVLAPGQKYRFVARIDEYDADKDLFLLDPVSATTR